MTDREQQDIFEHWLDQFKRLIFKVVRAYTVTAMDRDDLFQEITVQVWRSIPQFRNESAVSTWIYRIALNTAISRARKERKHQSESLDTVQHLLLDNTHPFDERLTWLYEEIHKLDEIDRSIALLMLDNFSYREMADMLGITETNVGVKIHRIKKHLITQSKNYDHGI